MLASDDAAGARRLIDPVQVIEDQHDRLTNAGRDQQAAERVEQVLALLLLGKRSEITIPVETCKLRRERRQCSRPC